MSAHLKRDPETEGRKIRDDLEFATAIMIYAIRKNLGGFSFSGLRIPRIVETWQAGNQMLDSESFATDVATFHEHLYERIVALAHNQEMTRQMWELNERTRIFREGELRRPDAARDILDKTANLLNALFNRNDELCSAILAECAERRYRLIMETFAPMRL
ncbi:FCD domain-containing protein [Phyllobacterium sp. 22229]|uniref:FCD domain-containing protein n=1 Tax=Agrobacterium radiobacter TaxID=362 RepID=A0ABD5LKK0_AGRRD